MLQQLFEQIEIYRRRHFTKRDLQKTRAQCGLVLSASSGAQLDKGIFLLVSNTNVPLFAKFQALLAKALMQEGYTPLILNQNNHDFAREYFKLFGIGNYLTWRELEEKINVDDATEVVKLLPRQLDVTTMKNIRYRGFRIGVYALSSTLRSFQKGLVNFDSPDFRQQYEKILRRGIRNTHIVEWLFQNYPVRLLMARDIGYVNNGPFLEYAVANGIDSVVIARGQRCHTWIFKRYTRENLGDHEFSISRPTWESLRDLPLTPVMRQQVEAEFSNRYQANSMSDLRRLQSKKKTFSPEALRRELGLDPTKKTAVIFAHVSWDGAFFFGEDLFESFDDWLLQTVKAACANPNLNWLVKLHPLNVLKSAQSGHTITQESEMVYLNQLMPLPSHVKIIHSDTPINTASLFPIIDYGLTVRGTIGMELPCLGISALTAGTGRYESRGFTIDSMTKEEYLQRLSLLHEIPPLTSAERELAIKHYYYLIIGRQFSFEDIAPMEVNSHNETDSDMYDNIIFPSNLSEVIQTSPSIQKFRAWVNSKNDLDLINLP